MKLQALLKNKYVLYVVVFLALTHVLGYLSIQDFDTLTFFVAIGILSTFFSNNLMVQLLTAIIATNTLFIGDSIREGMEKNKEDEEEEEEETDKKKVQNAISNALNSVKTTEKDEKKDEKFTQRNIPISGPASLHDEKDESVGNRIDYATTLEQAYDNLQNMLGSEGMKGLTDETKRLAKQQKSLVNSLKDITPALKGAKETMNVLQQTMPELNSLQEMMKGLSIKKKNK